MARPDASRALDLRRLKLADLVGLDVEHQEHVAREAAAAEAVAGRQRRGRIPIDADRRHVSRVNHHRTRDARMIESAREILTPLPLPGEAVHVILSGSFRPFTIIPAIVEIVAPAAVTELVIATLSTNQHSSDELFALLDRGRIKACTVLGAEYFASTDPGVWEHLQAGLQRRGHRCEARRNHAKLVLMTTSDGRFYVAEGSGNLRSCNAIEQLTLFNSRELFEFHREWIMDALAHGDQTR